MRTVAVFFLVLIRVTLVGLLPQAAECGESIWLSIDIGQQRSLLQERLGANNECVFRPVGFDRPAYSSAWNP